MIGIINVSPENVPNTGINQYEVRINRKIIAKFEHNRQFGALAQCLRDAADAVERQEKLDKSEMIKVIFDKIDQENNRR